MFICEGTRIMEKSILREKEVYQKALRKIIKIKGLVAVDYSIGDVIRFKTLLKIAKKTKRIIALPYNYFNYLSVLEKEGVLRCNGIKKVDLQNVRLYAKRKIIFKKWERDLIKNYKTCNSKDIRNNKEKFMLVLNFYQVQELIDIQPDKNSYYLRAITEPHSEEMEISEERFINWITHFNMQGLKKEYKENGKIKMIFERAHISGHISGKELFEFIKKIKPEMVIPIHTEFPEEFKKMHKNVKIVKKDEIVEL
jgi:ribonuclease J